MIANPEPFPVPGALAASAALPPPRDPDPAHAQSPGCETPAPQGFTPCGRARPGSPRCCWRRTMRRWAWESAAGSPGPSRRGPGPGPPAAGRAAAPGPPLLLPPSRVRPRPRVRPHAGSDAHAPVAGLGRAPPRGHVHPRAPPRRLQQSSPGHTSESPLAHNLGKLRPGRPAEPRLCKNASVYSFRKVILLLISARRRGS